MASKLTELLNTIKQIQTDSIETKKVLTEQNKFIQDYIAKNESPKSDNPVISNSKNPFDNKDDELTDPADLAIEKMLSQVYETIDVDGKEMSFSNGLGVVK
ncbi:hypothetical protein [Spiroplasma endosymbiont of Labia minor]|uniref:hypothetical protein n=1 Tax=Spiroplasma endosymbiont of Labia minor TaxID=3066305 RepID=UPI0030D39B37